MKKMLSFMFVIMLIIPCIVSADTIEEKEVVAQTTKYYKTVTIYNNSGVLRNANMGEMSSLTTEVTKEEFDNAETTTEPVAPLSDDYFDVTIETTYKRLTTTINKLGTAFFTYESELYWKNIPKVRSYDIMGIGHAASVENAASSVGFTMTYCTSSSNCYYSNTYQSKIGTYGSSAVFPLPTGTLVSMTQVIEFTVEKTTSSNTITYQEAVGDYAHATKTITQSNAYNNHGVNIGGLYYENVSSYYDTTPAAAAEWRGTW